MSNRIHNILSVMLGATASLGKFSELPLSAQTKVVFSCFQRVNSGLNWWNNVLESESDQYSEVMRKRATQEVNTRLTAQHTLLDFINRASHYSSGKEIDVGHDLAHLSIDKAPEDSFIEDDEYEFSSQVVNGNPFAWAKQLLVNDNKWPNDWVSPDEPLNPLLWEVSKTYDKYAARYMALAILAEMNMYSPPPRKDDDLPSDIVLIAACSKKLAEITTAKSRSITLRGLRALIRQNYSNTPLSVTKFEDGERVTVTYSAEQIIAALDDGMQLDIEDAELQAEKDRDEEAKADTKAMKAEIKSFVRSAIMTSTVIHEMTSAAEQMIKAGVSQATVDAMMKAMTAKLMPEPKLELPATEDEVPVVPPAETSSEELSINNA